MSEPLPRLAFADVSVIGSQVEAEVRAAIDRVLRSSWFVLGPEVEAFERELAETLGFAHAVGVGNGTDALALALAALGVGPGDEVVTTPLTAAFTALAISRIGAIPVFADVEPDTLGIAPAGVEARLTARTRAVVPVHLYGNACDMDAILAIARRHGLAVVEDACQAHGASLGGRALGSFGEAGALSFYPTKNLGALGDGGMVVTANGELAAKIRRLRNGGQSSRYEHRERGVNSRLDELQAAVLRAKLPHLEEWNGRRRSLAAAYDRALEGLAVKPVAPRPGSVSARHLYVVRTPEGERDRLRSHLEARGVETLVHYPIPTHLQPAYGQPRGSCPEAEAAADAILSLPLHPAMSETDVERVAEGVAAFFG